MVKLSINLIATTLIFVSFFTSCMQEVTVKTKTELITQSNWKFDNATATGFGDISNYPQLACFKDNTFTFAANGTLTVDEGANVCSPTTAGSYTWVFQSNETMLQLSAPIFPGGSTTFTIVSLTETNLVVSQDVNLPPTTTVTITFKH